MTSRSDFLFVEEVARMCRTPASSVRYWLCTGRLASVKPGKRRLIRRDDLERFLRESGQAPAPSQGRAP
jgi:excisionase family DNA binding protein